jgi:hypothetical protein
MLAVRLWITKWNLGLTFEENYVTSNPEKKIENTYAVVCSCDSSALLAVAPKLKSLKISLLGLGRSVALKVTCRVFYCMYWQIWGYAALQLVEALC